MIDTAVLPKNLINDLKERGHTEELIAKMSPQDAFNEYCSWHGLIGWGDILWSAVQEFKDSDCT